MARWKLMTSHYLNVDGEEWEYMELDRSTGRQRRTKFKVPRLLDVNDPTCWTHKFGAQGNEEGEIIVCHSGKGEPKDIVFYGDPSPDMFPLDDEAKELSAKFADKWKFNVENAAGDFSQSLIEKFQNQQAAIASKPVEIPGLSDLVASINSLVKQNQTVIDGRRV